MGPEKFFAEAIKDFGGIVVMVDPQNPFMQPEIAIKIVEAFGDFGYTPEMFREDIESYDGPAYQRSQSFLRSIVKAICYAKGKDELIYIVLKIDNRHVAVPFNPNA